LAEDVKPDPPEQSMLRKSCRQQLILAEQPDRMDFFAAEYQ
jgi:hypothetical protein